MVDARIVQTVASLSAAILELAAERPVSQIPVSDITRAAGINRATFYNHYSSAGALLADVVSTELDDIRAADHALRVSGEIPAEAITLRGIDAVFSLIERHRRVFELSLGDARDGSLHRVLSSHFETTNRVHLANFTGADEPVADAAIIARFVAEGSVGAIETWLLHPEITREQLGVAIFSALPRWWH